jgi:hypothetical protein
MENPQPQAISIGDYDAEKVAKLYTNILDVFERQLTLRFFETERRSSPFSHFYYATIEK